MSNLRIAQSQLTTIKRHVQYDTVAIAQDKHTSNLELNHASTALIGTSSGLTLPPALPISLLAKLDALPPEPAPAPGISNLSAPPLDATGNAERLSAGDPLTLSGGLGSPSCSSFLMARVVRVVVSESGARRTLIPPGPRERRMACSRSRGWMLRTWRPRLEEVLKLRAQRPHVKGRSPVCLCECVYEVATLSVYEIVKTRRERTLSSLGLENPAPHTSHTCFFPPLPVDAGGIDIYCPNDDAWVCCW